MTQQIKIKSGSHKIRGKDVELAGMVFPMIEEFKMGAAGGYVTVDGKAIAAFQIVTSRSRLTPQTITN